METSTQNLELDHQYILQLLEVMEQMVETRTTQIEDFETVVELIRNFADGFHHAKEEHLLFPLLAQKGFSPEQGPVAVMLYEHIQGRNFVKALADELSQIRQNKTSDFSLVYQNVSG